MPGPHQARRRPAYRPSEYTATRFAFGVTALTKTNLASDELVFNYLVSGWLLGEDPPAFDILAWNAEGTNLPARLHAEFLVTVATFVTGAVSGPLHRRTGHGGPERVADRRDEGRTACRPAPPERPRPPGRVEATGS